MNRTFKATLLTVAVASLIAMPVTLNATTHYENAFDLMKAFLNLEVNPQAPIGFWVEQFKQVLAKKGEQRITQLRPFLDEFSAALKLRSAAGIGLAFKKHKDKFGEPELAAYLENQLKQPNGLTMLNNILKARLNK